MITLQPFKQEDFSQLIEWIDSPKLLLQWAGPTFHYPLTIEQLETYIKTANQKNADTYIYKVIETETNTVVGHISLGRMDRKNQSARIGKVLVGVQKSRGRGIGQQMIKEVLKLAFHEHKLHRVSLGVYDFNISAIACYEKAGFNKEGLLRDIAKFENDYWSMWEMSILKSEWDGGSCVPVLRKN